MSWSFSGIGRPEALKRALDKHSEQLGTDPAGDPRANLSRYEFDAAKSHLAGLLDAADQQTAVALTASGYASIDHATGVVTPKSVSVDLKPLGTLCE
jgi:hypothetical protein